MSDTRFFSPRPPTTLRSSQFRDISLWLLRRRQRFRVVGTSMTPLLNPGEEVLIDPGAYHRCPPQPGDLVVATHPRDKSLRLIKWVVYVDQQACFLKGINATASTDSREFGLVPFKTLMGKVVCRFP